MPKLVIIAKGNAREIEMGQELTIGRGYSNLLRLEGEEISRVHAIIYKREHNFILRDLDSKNGVYVNGEKVATTELGPGDLLQLGKYRMVFNPPPNFDMLKIANNGSQSQYESGSVHNSPRGIVHVCNNNFENSQLFCAPEQPGQPQDVRLSELIQEEVVLLTRTELNDKMAGIDTTIRDKAADYQEEFFTALVRSSAGTDEIPNSFFTSVLHALARALSADRGVIVVRDPETNMLSPGAIYPSDSDVALNRVVLRSGFTEGKAVLCPETRDCGLFRDSATIAREKIGTLLSIPLGDQETTALLYLDRQGETENFNTAHLIVAARVARLLELQMIENSNISKETAI